MSVNDALCDGVRILLNEARAFVPATGLGVIQQDGHDHATFIYVDAFGATGYRAPLTAIPDGLQANAIGNLLTDVSLDAGHLGLVETRLLHTGFAEPVMRDIGPLQEMAVRRTIVRAAPGFENDEPAALLVALGEACPLTPSQIEGIDRLASRVAAYAHHVEPPHEQLERARRLEAVARMLPAMFRVLDVREIFDQLSTIAKDVLRHDFASLGLFLEDLSKLVLHVQTSGGPHEYRSGPMPFPKVQTEHWLYRIVDDLAANPLERESFKGGGRSSIRVAIRVDDAVLGALSFTSSDPEPYTATDLVVCRRVAEYVGLALSHQRLADEARRAAEATARVSRLESRVRALTDELDARTGARRLVGESAAWRQALTQSTQVAPTDATVLLLGESGTGKEVVARFVHRASSRSSGPFIALNCAALPEQLLEAELFGYERGAYTGATQSKPGQLEQAAGGTLFLDEVGEMSPSAQAKFLRVLQEREFQRLGGTRVLRTDARIVAATNRDLERAIAAGQFREDLYYRLNVFAIQLPALRDRSADILPLSEALLSEIGRSLGRPPAALSSEASKALVEYHWPGNVRELRNILERAAILCEGGPIALEHLAISRRPPPVRAEPQLQTPVPQPSSIGSAVELQSLERKMVEQALQKARFNKTRAAKALGLTRQQLYVRMRRYGLE